MNSQDFVIIGVFALGLAACQAPTDRYVVLPNPEAETAAQDFLGRYPEARLYFSPRRGSVLAVHGGMEPLPYEAAAATREAALHAIHQFFRD